MRAGKIASLVAGLALVASAALASIAAPASAGATRTYIVVYAQPSVSSDAAAKIQSAGGTLVASYGQIGVVVARSSNDAFASTLRTDARIQGVSATDAFGVQLPNEAVGTDATRVDAADLTPAPGADNLSALQWDMNQIQAPAAHEINGGSSSVVVGDIDTGLDFTHPDLAPNYDATDSTDCTSGAPAPLGVGNDVNGHGTHTAGTIAAAKNTIGIVGVAPNVKIAGIKAGNDAGFFFPEAVVCAFMWAGTHHVNVTNNSYFADPWLFNCRNDPEQRSIWAAERRAISFAQSHGTLVVAAEGNEADDLAHPTQDVTSPDDTTPVTRAITNACAVVPVEVPGVVGVTADGNLQLKSFYSSYGMGIADVMAPGGDSVLQVTAAAPNGRVLSTYPASAPCLRKVTDGSATYCYLQGTSMASPHAVGVAALIESMGITAPGAVAARLMATANGIPCPDVSIYAFFPSVSNGAPQVCTGTTDYNSFAGHGQINALAAVGG
jgi:lantibiotic leader peptide-processing serine protease